MWRTPAGRGFLMLAAMSACFGFAMNAHNNIVTNYFEDVLHFSGPQFGYITAIREVGGFVLIFLTALLYRVSLQKVTAGALVVLALGYAFFSVATSFVTVIPWVIITSFGFHTVLQTQPSLGMSLTTQERSGAILGRMAAFTQGGTFVAYVMIFLTFHFASQPPYRATFIILGAVAFLGAIAIVRFPHLARGETPGSRAEDASAIVFKREYRYYYWLNLFDGARQQIFFSFGLWVLVEPVRLHRDPHVTAASGRHVRRDGLDFTAGTVDRPAGRTRNAFRSSTSSTSSRLPASRLRETCGWPASSTSSTRSSRPLSSIGGATYLRKIAVPEDIASSLAMGVTILHATAIVVPVVAGFILNLHRLPGPVLHRLRLRPHQLRRSRCASIR